MPREQLLIDGLWRCLCPSVDVKTFNSAARLWSNLWPRPALSCGAVKAARQTRLQSTSPTIPARSTNHSKNWSPWHRDKHGGQDPHGHRWVTRRKGKFADDQAYEEYLFRLWKRHRNLPRALFRIRGPSEDDLRAVGTHDLGDALRALRTVEGQYHTVAKIVHHLVAEKHLGR
jgi:hypothetical protein